MSVKSLRFGVASLSVAAAFAATAVVAQAAMTVTVGSPVTLAARVAVTVPVTVSCDAWDPSLTQAMSGIGVSIEEASGNAIAYGSGFLTGAFPGPELYLCDGSPHTIPVTVQANPAGPPFHGGRAVVSASANALAGIPCVPGETFFCFFNQVTQSGVSGPTTVLLH
jgi:hypothetical protein